MANLTESIRADLYRLFEEEDMNECTCDGECKCDEDDVNEASETDLDESDEEVTEASETDLDESDEEIDEEVETVTEEEDLDEAEEDLDEADDLEEGIDPKERWKRDLANLYSSRIFEAEDDDDDDDKKDEWVKPWEKDDKDD